MRQECLPLSGVPWTQKGSTNVPLESLLNAHFAAYIFMTISWSRLEGHDLFRRGRFD